LELDSFGERREQFDKEVFESFTRPQAQILAHVAEVELQAFRFAGGFQQERRVEPFGPRCSFEIRERSHWTIFRALLQRSLVEVYRSRSFCLTEDGLDAAKVCLIFSRMVGLEVRRFWFAIPEWRRGL
jgi:hypothetical protein